MSLFLHFLPRGVLELSTVAGMQSYRGQSAHARVSASLWPETEELATGEPWKGCSKAAKETIAQSPALPFCSTKEAPLP